MSNLNESAIENAAILSVEVDAQDVATGCQTDTVTETGTLSAVENAIEVLVQDTAESVALGCSSDDLNVRA